MAYKCSYTTYRGGARGRGGASGEFLHRMGGLPTIQVEKQLRITPRIYVYGHTCSDHGHTTAGYVYRGTCLRQPPVGQF